MYASLGGGLVAGFGNGEMGKLKKGIGDVTEGLPRRS